jgi:hypothetical protein
MKRIGKMAAALALAATLAAPALAGTPKAASSGAQAPFDASAATPKPADSATEGKELGAQALQPTANPTALLFLTIMNSGGAGRYGR